MKILRSLPTEWKDIALSLADVEPGLVHENFDLGLSVVNFGHVNVKSRRAISARLSVWKKVDHRFLEIRVI